MRFLLLILTVLVAGVEAARPFGLGRRQEGVVGVGSIGSSTCNSLTSAEAKIQQYLESFNKEEGEFYIQGWRWHTMSLVREASRLHRLAQKLASTTAAAATMSESELSGLKKAVDYVVEFNMKGLHKIEKDLFFPWVRNKVGVGSSSLKDKKDSDIILPPADAFKVLMDRLDSDRKNIESLGRSLNEAAKVASDPSTDEKIRADCFSRIVSESEAIADRAQSMLVLEDSLLVPVVARVVPAPEQKSFNDKVIRKLGILDSRLHLVGMHEAVLELDNDRERQLFQTAIPKIPQMMIPRWKRLLYEPRVGVLEEVPTS